MKFLVFVLMTVFSSIGWWLFSKWGILGSIVGSTIGGVVGVVLAVWFYNRFLG